ncbi:MAG TPA: hypothetical protein VE981_12605 [Planctomycetota bacterium]|nr:hypothetical protein [Planctomycetota bacterium]
MNDTTEPTSSNSFALSGRQWAGLAFFTVAVYLLAPLAWRRAEKLEAGPDYRIPYELSSDYWLWSRMATQAAATHDTILVGDSVVWGQYVRPGETLSHYLNALEGRDRYANLGLNGSYPAALAGLVEHYGGAIRGKRVILHCNPLWLSSPKVDLREDEELHFNHLGLIPQFSSRIPGYKEEVSRRIGKVVDRNVPFNGWTNHLQIAYFGGASIPGWTLDHPYESPFKPLSAGLPSPADKAESNPVPWTQTDIPKRNDMAWVDLAGSIQWASFQRVVDLLQQRGNTVLVVIGPYNEHLLKESSRVKYQELQRGIEDWLKERKVAYVAPAPLPSDQYGDASHPLSAGYALLAKELVTGGFLAAAESKPER